MRKECGFMSIKLFATDLDGTLLNKNGEISPANKQAIKEMAKEGIIPTIATGRMYEASRRFAEQLELDVPIITYNGALIKSVSGKVYFEGFLPPKIVSEIYDYCKEMKYYFQTYQDDKLYYEAYTDKTKGYEEGINIKGYAIGEKVYKLVDRIPKILVITTSNEESDEVARLFNEKFSGIPKSIQDELRVICILFTQEVGGIFTIAFEEDGTLVLETAADEEDITYDEVSSGLLIGEIRRKRNELLESLNMYYRIFILNEKLDAILED